MINNKGVRYEHYDRNYGKTLHRKEAGRSLWRESETLRTWLLPHKEAIGERVSRYFTSLQIQLIFDRLGLPQ